MDDLDVRINNLEGEISALSKTLASLIRQRRTRDAREFIRVNGVTADKVQRSSDDDMPWFGDVWSFRDWLREQPTRREFCEWNTQIHWTHRLLEGKFEPSPATIDDLSD